MQTKLTATLLLASLFYAPLAFGQDTNTVEAQPANPAIQMRLDAAARVEAQKAQMEERRALIQATVEERLENREVKNEERRALLQVSTEERAERLNLMMEERRAMLEQKRAAFASSTEERRAMLAEKFTERVTARFDHVTGLLNAMVLRLYGLADRIDARIDVLAAEGLDVTEAERLLTEAREAIAAAEDEIELVSDKVAEALASETPREALQAVRPAAEEAKQALRAAHQSLVEVVTSLPNRSTDTNE